MITDGTMQWMVNKVAVAGPDSPTQAIVDWILLGRYAGFRASEWSKLLKFCCAIGLDNPMITDQKPEARRLLPGLLCCVSYPRQDNT